MRTLYSNTTRTFLSYTVNSDVIATEHALRCYKTCGLVFVNGYFKTKGTAIPNGTVLFTFNNASMDAVHYALVYGYDLGIKGKLEPSGRNLCASGPIAAYSSYCYLSGFFKLA